jgi:NAD(P)-dependent dehydrogenase (short-subunit alcohol dehydrogenase family)
MRFIKMDRLKGKRALVTGGSSGIGLETARQFTAEGARVAITGRDPKTFEQARRELGEHAVYISADAADTPGQKKLADRIKEEFGNLDILFVNAGSADLRSIEQWDEARL